VAFVLLLACVNVANLQLVRATTRSRELALRAALGATRWHLARALLTESLVLSAAGAVLGVLVAWWGVEILRDAMPLNVPRVAGIAVNVRVLTVTALVTIGTGVLFGLLPAISFSRPELSEALKDGGRSLTAGSRRQWLRTFLVVWEVALAVVLLVGSGLFLVSFARVTHVELGMNLEHVLTMQIRPAVETQGTRERMVNVLDQVARMHGVDVAAVVGCSTPLSGCSISYPIRVPGGRLPDDRRGIFKREVSPDYFRVLQVPLVAGRFFMSEDRKNSPRVVILNQTAARRYFGESSAAIGRSIDLDRSTRQVVGVVGDVRQDGPEEPAAAAAFYVPFMQSDLTWGDLMLRTSGDTATIISVVKQAIWTEFPDAAIPETETLRGVMDVQLATRRFNMLLLGLFGLLGIMIAGLGVYGVMAYTVTQRTHEIGVRMALGAAPSTILRSVLGRAGLVLVSGTLVGLIGASGLAGLATKFLFQVQPHDARVYIGASLILIAEGIAAALVPARRAALVDPLVALKYE
jgi:putative ABC transport system permease protein